ncbi:ABC-2 type transport system permease protein [Paenibacillus sophorae]|uniref:Transport permease protein n=1 Tax=Paenibacillus sophorae TaxID=1333845 RepID=A0A1H8G3I8_9BACL|nr:ABC transporter permease [Paenibacillus sophorae]QWU14081.1 ABC transporter permease [Paenibacillus sophorae]SEN38542.1 ABC-2 type transport system permease protein [Paenibacillus sophorae]
MWHTAFATLVRNQRSNLRAYPWTFTFGHIIDGTYLVLVTYFSYVYLIQGDVQSQFAAYAGTSDYLTYVIIGGALNLFSVSMIMNVSRALITEWREGTLEALLLSPSSRFGYFAGTAVQQLLRSLFELAVVLIFGIAAGLRLPHFDFVSLLIGICAYLLSCFSMGLLLGCVMLHTRDTFFVQNTLFAFTALLCGFQFPREYLPEALRLTGNLFPLTDALALLRGSLLTGGVIRIGDIVPVLLLCAVYIALALWSGRRIELRMFERY